MKNFLGKEKTTTLVARYINKSVMDKRQLGNYFN